MAWSSLLALGIDTLNRINVVSPFSVEVASNNDARIDAAGHCQTCARFNSEVEPHQKFTFDLFVSLFPTT